MTPESSSTGARSAGPQVKTEAAGAARSVADSARATAGEAKKAVGDIVTSTKDKVGHIAGEQKVAAADHIGRYGSALRDSARAMEEEDPNVAYFANCAAERIERVAGYVRESDFASLKRDTSELAHRHPALFLGGMLVTGLIVGTMIKATLKGANGDNGDNDEWPESARGSFDDAGFGSPGYAAASPAGSGIHGGAGSVSAPVQSAG